MELVKDKNDAAASFARRYSFLQFHFLFLLFKDCCVVRLTQDASSRVLARKAWHECRLGRVHSLFSWCGDLFFVLSSTQLIIFFSLIDPTTGRNNPEKFCVATSDIELRARLQNVVGVPLLYIGSGV